ncbi:GNAT family N-acetyltransferase [Brevibacillus agri]|uniref:GNAT family N-acetyltransferase n=1 Tax=Brevibacillus agri TaxID=51101 RepID=UPI003D70EC9A
MIRNLKERDLGTVVAMLQKEVQWRPVELAAILKSATVFLCEEQGEIVACGLYDLTSFGEEGTAEMYVYTRPEQRKKGIGSRLFDLVWTQLLAHEQKPTAVVATYRIDEGDAGAFFAKKGFAPLWGQHTMKYTGGMVPEPTLAVKPFAEQELPCYIQSQSDAYYEVRKSIDLKTYRLTDYCEQTMDSWQKWLLTEMKDDIYMFYEEQGEFVGSLIVTPHGEAYDVFVDPKHQKKGYGKQLARFFINRTLEKGLQPYLVTGTHNKPAIALYEGTGFRITQTMLTAKRALL